MNQGKVPFNQDNFMDEINRKYSEQEYELEKRLNKILSDEKQQNLTMEKSIENETEQEITTEMSRKRNADLIKDLEISKARLRSKATYSPTDMILEKAIKKYRQEVGLADKQQVETTIL